MEVAEVLFAATTFLWQSTRISPIADTERSETTAGLLTELSHGVLGVHDCDVEVPSAQLVFGSSAADLALRVRLGVLGPRLRLLIQGNFMECTVCFLSSHARVKFVHHFAVVELFKSDLLGA